MIFFYPFMWMADKIVTAILRPDNLNARAMASALAGFIGIGVGEVFYLGLAIFALVKWVL